MSKPLRSARCTQVRTRAVAALGALALLGPACSSPPPPRHETRVEKVHREKVIGTELVAQFEDKLKKGHDQELEVYLRQLILKLVSAQPDLVDAGAGAILIHPVNGKWRSFAVPGNRVYLSIELLKKLNFESEVAALIAIQLGHLQKGHLLDRVYGHLPSANPTASMVPFGASAADQEFAPEASALPRHIDFFGPGGALDFTEEQVFQAIDAAVGILHASGIDPRGISSIWKAHVRDLKYSPYDEILLNHAADHTLTALAQRAPLRNPVVTDEKFRKILARIQKL